MITPLVCYFTAFALAIASLLVWVLANTAPAGAALAPWLGLAVAGAGLALTLFSPLAALADESFAAHMVEHEMFLFVIPIAFLAARPSSLLLRCLRRSPLAFRRAAARLVSHPVRQAAAALTHPLEAFAVSTLTLWLWHVPELYDLALSSEAVHAAEHLSLLGSAVLYWYPVFKRGGGHRSLNTGAKCALYLIAGAMQGSLLGAFLTLSNHVFYSGYLMIPQASAGAVLADQQLGGAIMWFSGPFFYGAAMALAVTWRASKVEPVRRRAQRP